MCSLNKTDIKILAENWELQRERLKNEKYKEAIDISSSCYIEFGVCGVSVFKFFKGKWRRKSVNYWKELSFKQFMDKLNAIEWEEL